MTLGLLFLAQSTDNLNEASPPSDDEKPANTQMSVTAKRLPEAHEGGRVVNDVRIGVDERDIRDPRPKPKDVVNDEIVRRFHLVTGNQIGRAAVDTDTSTRDRSKFALDFLFD